MLLVAAMFSLRRHAQTRTLRPNVCQLLWPTLICLACSAVRAEDDDGLIVAATAEAEVLFIPDRELLIDGELLGGTLRVRGLDDATIITFADLLFESLHHVSTTGQPTLRSSDHLVPEHSILDSHLLVTHEMIGGSAGPPERETGVGDPSAFDPAGIADRIPPLLGLQAIPYAGDINGIGSAFFLDRSYRGSTFDLARLVGRPGSASHIEFEVLGGVRSDRGQIFNFDLMWGTSTGSPPTVSLAVSANDASFTAEASDADGQINVVQFYANGMPIRDCRFTEAPYHCTSAWWFDRARKVTVRATDDSGYSAYAAETIRAPSVFFAYPDRGHFGWFDDPIAGETVSLVALALGADHVEFYANGEPIPECSFAADRFQRMFSCDWEDPPVGDHRIEIRASNAYGDDVARSSRIEVTDQPMIYWRNPNSDLTGDRAVPVGTTVMLNAEARNTDVVEFYVDGELIPGCRVPDAPFVCDWMPDSGDYRVTARAINENGVADAGTRAVTTADLPFVLLTAPDRNLYRQPPGTTFTLVAETPAADLVEFFANDTPIPNCRLDQAPYECVWTPKAGSYDVFARASNADGSADSNTRFVSINDSRPLLSITSPPNGHVMLEGESLILSATLNDREDDAVGVTFTANTGAIPQCEILTSPYQCEWTPTEGSYAITATAVDDQGNTASSSSVWVSVYPEGTGVIVDELPAGADGSPVVEETVVAPITGAGADAVSQLFVGDIAPETFVRLPVAGPVTLASVHELQDNGDIFSFTGTVPMDFATRPTISVGPFHVATSKPGDFSALYALTFADGVIVNAELRTSILPVPEPDTSVLLMCCASGIAVWAGRRRSRSRRGIITRSLATFPGWAAISLAFAKLWPIYPCSTAQFKAHDATATTRPANRSFCASCRALSRGDI